MVDRWTRRNPAAPDSRSTCFKVVASHVCQLLPRIRCLWLKALGLRPRGLGSGRPPPMIDGSWVSPEGLLDLWALLHDGPSDEPVPPIDYFEDIPWAPIPIPLVQEEKYRSPTPTPRRRRARSRTPPKVRRRRRRRLCCVDLMLGSGDQSKEDDFILNVSMSLPSF